MPIPAPVLISIGAADAGADAADPLAASATRADASPSVRRYREVVPLYHKVVVNGTRRRRQRRPDDPSRPLPDEPAPEEDDRGGPRADRAAAGGLPGLRARRCGGAMDADRA